MKTEFARVNARKELLGVKHPLSAQMAAGLENLTRLGLKTETSMRDDIESASKFAEKLISAHAPVNIGEMRHNIASTDPQFRRESINHIINFVDTARHYANIRQINMHFAPKRWHDEHQSRGNEGTYDFQIDGIREIASFAEQHRIDIVLENNNAYWTGISDKMPPEKVEWEFRNSHFGSSPEEWIQICEDVDLPNVWLCLDSSHTCTYAHTFTATDREAKVLAFLERPDLIKHVHWNDNYLYDPRGRIDSHAVLGKGSLPLEMHRLIKSLDATILLEHFYSLEELEEELEFIRDL